MSDKTTGVVVPRELLDRMIASFIAIGRARLEAGKRYRRTMRITPSGDLEITWVEMLPQKRLVISGEG